MRRFSMVLGCILLAFTAVGVAGQAIGDPITVAGCLVQSDDGEHVEFMLEHVTEASLEGHEIELFAGEGVNLAGHVGHTVEVTGVVIADEADKAHDDEEDEHEDDEDDEGDELHIRVDNLGHRAASCSIP